MKLPFKSLWSEFKAFAFKGNMIDLAVAVVIGAAFSGVIKALVEDIVMPAVEYGVGAVNEAKKVTNDVATSAAHTVGLATTQPTTQAATTPATTPATEPTTAPAVAPTTAPFVVSTTGPTTVPATQPYVVVYVNPPAAPAAEEKKPEPVKPVDFKFMIGKFKVGAFITELLNFIIVAFAVFIIVVKLMGSAMARLNRAPAEPTEPTTKECPECLSIIPYKAKRCPNCTSILVPPPGETKP